MSQLTALLHDPLGIVLAIVALGVLIIVHEGGHYFIARASGMRVDRFSIGFGPPIAKFQRGETQFQIGLVPLGGFVHIAGLNPGDDTIAADDPRAYPNRSVLQRLATIFAGPATNYIFAALMMMFVFTVFGLPVQAGAPMVTELVAGKPAAAAGVLEEDEVLTADGKAVKDITDVSPIVDASQGRPVTFLLRRQGREKTLQITPVKDGEHFRIGIGIAPREVWQRGSIKDGLVAGVTYPYEKSKQVLAGFALIFKGKQKAEFSGPLGIVRVLKGQILRGPAEGLAMVGFISVLLGLFNLLPLPALDGGRLVFLLTEGLARRKLVPERIEQNIHAVGMLALLSFILIITVVNDVPRLFHR